MVHNNNNNNNNDNNVSQYLIYNCISIYSCNIRITTMSCSVKMAELPEAQSSSYGGRPPFEVNITEVIINQLITGIANPSPPRLRVLSPFYHFQIFSTVT